MAKKKKKKVQKRKQAKALKQRTRKKLLQKKKAKRPSHIASNFPRDLSPSERMKAEKAMLVVQPFLELLPVEMASNPDQLISLMQLLLGALRSKDEEQRNSMLESLKEIYEDFEQQPMPFEEFFELMLKRDIHYFPELHDEEERLRWSPEELKAAVEWQSELAEEEEKAEKKSDVTKGITTLDFNSELLSELLTQEELQQLEDWKSQFQGIIDQLKPAAEEDPNVVSLMEYQSFLLTTYTRYLEHMQFSSEDIRAHQKNVQVFLNTFLKERVNQTLWSCTPDDVEEFILDYYIRKVNRTPSEEEELLSSMKNFFTFLGSLKFVEEVTPILERIEECATEFNELIEEYRESN
ncbi:MAG: hypothetical protein D6732_08265 [Methanobacteriota archaeon]|nr:MAG: hypothetical protein D6732_08265 [Euryarchaeota archaeon]